jgi:hypothetical protein
VHANHPGHAPNFTGTPSVEKRFFDANDDDVKSWKFSTKNAAVDLKQSYNALDYR